MEELAAGVARTAPGQLSEPGAPTPGQAGDDNLWIAAIAAAGTSASAGAPLQCVRSATAQ
jgi:hypothetical protein